MRKACQRSKICGAVRVILTALAVPGFALGLATAAGELKRGEVPVYGQPTSVVWADRVYSNKHDLATWLRSRGVTYTRWAARHPATAQILERRPAREPAAGAPSRPRALGDSRDPAMAIALALASLLGLLALGVTLRVQLPRLALARPARFRPSRPHWEPRTSAAKRAPRRAFLAQVLERSLSASRDAAGTLRRQVGRPERRTAVARFAQNSVTATRDALAGFERSATQSAAVVEHESHLARISLRRHAPDIALYVTSVLLALVVGASLALYLN